GGAVDQLLACSHGVTGVYHSIVVVVPPDLHQGIARGGSRDCVGGGVDDDRAGRAGNRGGRNQAGVLGDGRYDGGGRHVAGGVPGDHLEVVGSVRTQRRAERVRGGPARQLLAAGDRLPIVDHAV